MALGLESTQHTTKTCVSRAALHVPWGEHVSQSAGNSQAQRRVPWFLGPGVAGAFCVPGHPPGAAWFILPSYSTGCFVSQIEDAKDRSVDDGALFHLLLETTARVLLASRSPALSTRTVPRRGVLCRPGQQPPSRGRLLSP